MTTEEERLRLARAQMVNSQLRARGISNLAVLEAFQQVPREFFVPPDQIQKAYGDHPLPIGHGQTISQPYVVAIMLQHLDPRSNHRVLDVGAGSGYQTALLARLVRHVYAIERIAALTERAADMLACLNVSNVTLCTGDGSMGWPEEAPFDRIICGAGGPDVPEPWTDQLADGGRIVLPIGGPETQTVVVVDKRGGKLIKKEVCEVRFVKLSGRQAWPED